LPLNKPENGEREGSLFVALTIAGPGGPIVTEGRESKVSISVQRSSSGLSGLTQVILDNGVLRASVLPELGAKMSSLVRLGSGREFLAQPDSRSLRRVPYGSAFEDHEGCGFDECFPTVAACEYPDGCFNGLRLPDHGEVWSAAWRYQIDGDELWLAVQGRKLPYIFRKRISMERGALVMHYELESVTDETFGYIWSAHPLLNADSTCRICLPAEVTEVFTGGERNDLSVLGSPLQSTGKRLHTDRLTRGICALHFPDSDESISFHFNPASAPYLGIWVSENGHSTAALAPCTSRSSSLAEAMEEDECFQLRAGEKRQWRLRLQIQNGLPEGLC
jgi:hypothetical protein